jgi:GTPase-activating protein SAC7
LKRYLNQLPEPIVPLEFYDRFRAPLRGHDIQAAHNEGKEAETEAFNENAIKIYQELVVNLPQLNRTLLLYILDLLAVFASKADINLMDASNLSAIFQPGLLSHPNHDMAPHEYLLSQNVLIFLIENQDHFLIGMKGTGTDEKTRKDIESPVEAPAAPTTPSASQRQMLAAVTRSSSNASAAADDVRKYGGVRRNVSTSSRKSRHSNGAPSPVTPLTTTSTSGGGVHRSNTVPSKKSPAIPGSALFDRNNRTSGGPPTPTSVVPQQQQQQQGSALHSPVTALNPPTPAENDPQAPAAASAVSTVPGAFPATPGEENIPGGGLFVEPPRGLQPQSNGSPSSSLAPSTIVPQTHGGQTSRDQLLVDTNSKVGSATTPTKDRSLPFFGKSPTSDSEKKEERKPKKLQKKSRIPGSSNPSAASSSASLGQGVNETSTAQYPPMPYGSNQHPHLSPTSAVSPLTPGFLTVEAATPVSAPKSTFPDIKGNPSDVQEQQVPAPFVETHQSSHSTLKPANASPTMSANSSVVSQSDFDQSEDPDAREEKKEKRRRWRISSAAKDRQDKEGKQGRQESDVQQFLGGGASGPMGYSGGAIGSNTGAEASVTSIGSGGKPNKSLTSDSQTFSSESSRGTFLGPGETDHHSRSESRTETSGPGKDGEKRGGFGWLKGKINEIKEERKERAEEKERAKSPPPAGHSAADLGSRQSLNVAPTASSISTGGQNATSRGPSAEIPRETKTEEQQPTPAS